MLHGDGPPTGGVSVVVPVYNSAETLDALVARLLAVLAVFPAHEVILVNDGSTDGSWDRVVELTARHAEVKGLSLARNVGQHNALLAGIRAACGSVIVTVDDDLQNPPEEIPKLLATLQEGHDVVYGTAIEQQHGFWRNAASRLIKLALQDAMGADTARKVSAFRAFRAEVCEAFADYEGPFVSVDVLLTWGTSSFGSVPVRHDPRAAGQSNYSVRKLVTHALNMMTGFTTRPLQVTSMIGFFLAAFGLGVLIYVLTRRILTGGRVPGFAFLASIIAIFSGAQLFSLGIIGEYLARMHFRLMQKPTYTIRRRTGNDGDEGRVG